MTGSPLSQWAASWWPAVANHLWQSTLVGVLALVVALLLENAPPRFRYGLWLAASVKFLIPIALLVSLGGYFKIETPAPMPAQAVAAAVATVSQPFSQLDPVAGFSDPLTVSPSHPLLSVLPVALAALWVSGAAVLVLIRARSWRTIATALRASSDVPSGRSVDLLRDVERTLGVRRPTCLRSSAAAVEPAVVGFIRPVLLWPTSLTERLSDAEMTAIFAHELTHLRHRDNLTALLHIVVETVFWFHPMTWWLSGRLVEERERACDQSVLAAGAEPQTYAQGLLTVCKMCLESPVRFAAGVTGAGLVRRVERIMRGDRSRRLRWVERVLLAATAVIIVTVPVAAGMFSPGPQLSLATIVAPATTTLQTTLPSAPPVDARATVAPKPVPPSFVATGTLPDILHTAGFTSLSAPHAPPPTPPADPDARKIARGDLIRIDRGPNNPWSMTVTANGQATLPGLGSTDFEGLTAKQVEYLVRQRLAESKLIDATDLITINVRYLSRVAGAQQSGSADPPTVQVSGAPVFVQGRVLTPGEVQLRGNRTLMRAINAAGGWAPDAGTEVWVLRPPAGSSMIATMDDPSVEKTRYLRRDLVANRVDPIVQPLDTIFVTTADVFWITGEIKSGGQKVYEESMTLFDAISLAGGLTDRGAVGRSFIQRKNSGGTYDQIKDLNNSTPILPRDTITIGRKLF